MAPGAHMLMSAGASWGLVSRQLRRQLSWEGVFGGDAQDSHTEALGELHEDWDSRLVVEARDISVRTGSTPLWPQGSPVTYSPGSLDVGQLGYCSIRIM